MSVVIDGTTGVSGADGSAATPALRGEDANTGIFFPAADTIAFSEGGVERLRIADAGQIGIGGANYGTSGQVLTSGGPSAAPSWTTPSGGITLGTAVPSSGAVTTITFTGIPAGVNCVTLMFTGVSTNGTSSITVNLGTSAGLETSGYLGSVSTIGTGAANGGAGLYFIFGQNNTAASVYNGSMIFSRLTGNTWVMQGIVARSDANSVNVLAGSKALAGVLDRVSISTVIGNAFDAGTINISYEA